MSPLSSTSNPSATNKTLCVAAYLLVIVGVATMLNRFRAVNVEVAPGQWAILGVLCIAGALLVNPVVAYALSRSKLHPGLLALFFFLSSLFLPAGIALLPAFETIAKQGMINTFWALVLPGLLNGFSVFLLKGFFDGLPGELYETAEIEGAGRWQVFREIGLKFSRPVLAMNTLGISSGVCGSWVFGFILPSDARTWTIMAWSHQLQHGASLLLATALPMWIVCIATQNAIIRAFPNGGGLRKIQKDYTWGLLALPVGLALAWSYLPLMQGEAIITASDRAVLGEIGQAILPLGKLALWMLAAGFFGPILLACLSYVAPGQRFLSRTLRLLPYLISGGTLFVLLMHFFSANFSATFGIFADLFSTVWIWAVVGPGCLVYLAVLKTIPKEVFEAAEIDGAGFLWKRLHLVLPALKPLLLVSLVGVVIGTCYSLQNILATVALMGGRGKGLYPFYEAFRFLNFGPATAMLWTLGAMLIGLTLIQSRGMCCRSEEGN